MMALVTHYWSAKKVNSNFDEIYAALGDGSSITNSIDFAVVAGYSTASGIATYATVSGVSTYAGTAGVATNSSLASVATYALTAGIATEAQFAGGLGGSPDIIVGDVTASSLSGAGQAITGIVTYLVAGDNIGIDTNFGTVTISNNKPDDFPSKWVQSVLEFIPSQMLVLVQIIHLQTSMSMLPMRSLRMVVV